MTVYFNIHANEWEFKEEIPFDIATVKDEEKTFELPLYDEEGNETESIAMQNCRVIELIGDDDAFLVVIEKALIKEQEVHDVGDSERVFNFVFHPDMPLWKQGEDIGVFYSKQNLPQELNEIKIG